MYTLFTTLALLLSLNASAASIEQLYDTVHSLEVKVFIAQSPKEKISATTQLEFARGMFVAEALFLNTTQKSLLAKHHKKLLKTLIAEEKQLHEASANAHEKILVDHTQAIASKKTSRRRWGISAILFACATAVDCVNAGYSLKVKVANISSTLFSLYQWRKHRKDSHLPYVPGSKTLKELKAIEPFWNGYATQQEHQLYESSYRQLSAPPKTSAERLDFIRALDSEWNPPFKDCNKTLK